MEPSNGIHLQKHLKKEHFGSQVPHKRVSLASVPIHLCGRTQVSCCPAHTSDEAPNMDILLMTRAPLKPKHDSSGVDEMTFPELVI